MYSALGNETPNFGEGTTPWLAKIYVEGEHVCDATLVSARWLITHSACARKTMPEVNSSPEKYSVARLGMFIVHSIS